MQSVAVEVSRRSIGETRRVVDSLDTLASGSVRFRIGRLAITANTTTYAEMGDAFGYWDFWPATDPNWGRVPAIGWATIIESNHPQIPTGGTYFGWFPMAQYADAEVDPTPTGCRDRGSHRALHAPIYTSFEHSDRDQLMVVAERPDHQSQDHADRHSVLRGLFLTGYLADAFFAAHQFFDAEQVIVLSASSKTAIGFADRVSHRDSLAVVGVTSPANVEMVADLGVYDTVLTYADLDTPAVLDRRSAVVIDMAGSGPVLDAVHRGWGDRLAYSMTVGRTHHGSRGRSAVVGPTPELFFAPTALTTIAEQGGDVDTLREGLAPALDDFIRRSRSWLDISVRHGAEGVMATWTDVLGGCVPPSVGCVATVHDQPPTGGV